MQPIAAGRLTPAAPGLRTVRGMTTPHRFASLALAAVAIVVLGACGDDASPGSSSDTAGAGPVAGDPSVAVTDNEFTPDEMTVAAGTTVTWSWGDDTAAHNVVGDSFASEIQSSGTFEHRFEDTGTFDYVCTLHQGMDGTIFVVPA